MIEKNGQMCATEVTTRGLKDFNPVSKQTKIQKISYKIKCCMFGQIYFTRNEFNCFYKIKKFQRTMNFEIEKR